MVRIWDPSKILQSGSYALCLLNQPVQSPSTLIKMWNKARFRVTVDGGTSIWTEIVNNTELKVEAEMPDLITGDFDSADMSHVELFRQLGAKVVGTPDQDYTDFTKCLQQLGQETLDMDLEAVFAFVESSGRLDQIMANLQTLFLAPDLLRPPVLLASSGGLTWLLGPGHHQILTRGCVTASSHCGLVPLDGKATVSTTGLKWNLAEGVLRFGELVSTSNGFDLSQECVTVATDSNILWTMDMQY